jgi:predicted small secreted protein
MKKTYATILAAVAAAALTAGCEQQPGPAEKAGKQIDQAVEKAGENAKAAVQKAEEKTATAVQKTEDYAAEKMKEAGKAVEQAGEKLKK